MVREKKKNSMEKPHLGVMLKGSRRVTTAAAALHGMINA